MPRTPRSSRLGLAAAVAVLGLQACSDNDLHLLPGDGDPELPAISVTPEALDFGQWRVTNGAQTLEVTVTNVGGGTLELSSVLADPATDPDFSVGVPGRATLGAGESTTFPVAFSPTEEGGASGLVHVASNDLDRPDAPVDLSAQGTQPRIELTPTSHDFGMVPAGTTASVTLHIRNVGSAELLVSSAVLGTSTAEIALDLGTGSNGNLPWVIVPSDEVLIQAAYTPVDEGIDAATVTVGSDDPLAPEVQALLSGAGPTFEGFSTGWYVWDDGLPYETTSNPSHPVDHHGDDDLYWYEPSGAHGLLDSIDPAADFAVMREYVLDRAGPPVESPSPFSYDGDSTLATFEYATFTYFLCDFWLDGSDDPNLYEVRSGAVDDGIQVMVNGVILGRQSLGEAGRTWSLAGAIPGAVNSLIVILVDDSAVDKYVYDLGFYRSGVFVAG